MMPNDNTQGSMSTPNDGCMDQVKTWRNQRKQKQTVKLLLKNSKLFLFENPNNKSNKNYNNSNNNNSDNKIIIIIKCRSRLWTLLTTNTKFPVTLFNNQKLLTIITKSATSDAVWVLSAPLKQLIHHLTWWIE